MPRFLTTIAAVFAMTSAQAQSELPFDVSEITRFDQPWAMAFLPDGRMLVTEKKGLLRLVGQDGQSIGVVRGLPDVDYFGQGGTRGAAVARGVLRLTERRGVL